METLPLDILLYIIDLISLVAVMVLDHEFVAVNLCFCLFFFYALVAVLDL